MTAIKSITITSKGVITYPLPPNTDKHCILSYVAELRYGNRSLENVCQSRKHTVVSVYNNNSDDREKSEAGNALIKLSLSDGALSQPTSPPTQAWCTNKERKREMKAASVTVLVWQLFCETF